MDQAVVLPDDGGAVDAPPAAGTTGADPAPADVVKLWADVSETLATKSTGKFLDRCSCLFSMKVESADKFWCILVLPHVSPYHYDVIYSRFSLAIWSMHHRHPNTTDDPTRITTMQNVQTTP